MYHECSILIALCLVGGEMSLLGVVDVLPCFLNW